MSHLSLNVNFLSFEQSLKNVYRSVTLLVIVKLLHSTNFAQPEKLIALFPIVTLSAVVRLGGIQEVALVIPLPKVIPLISVSNEHP